MSSPLPLETSDLPRALLRDGWWLQDEASVDLLGPPTALLRRERTPMMSCCLSVPLAPTQERSLAPKLALAAALTGVGDWLFWGRVPGLSVALFLAAVGLAVLGANRVRARGRELAGLACLGLAALLPLVEAVSLLSLGLGVAGLAVFAVAATGEPGRGVTGTLAMAWRHLAAGSFQLAPDMARGVMRAFAGGGTGLGRGLVAWVVPLLFFGLFAALLASANPLIEGWLVSLDPSEQLQRVSVGRLLFWAVLVSFVWPFTAMRRRERRAGAGRWAGLRVAVPVEGAAGQLLGEAAILRSLVLFNLLFALQSGLDIAYLWSGAALPEGLTYAAYAQRGAYPLIATALLAAGFVLVALRPGGPGERSAPIRALVYLWVGQNLLLVLSSTLRLELYVAAYSLTLTRAAAFVWMGLVAAGLGLIVARIALRRSNAWLVGANLLALALTLYACAFVNAEALVAGYNVRHRGEQRFDVDYALGLGPHAIPAVDRYLADASPGRLDGAAILRRDTLADHHGRAMQDWRAWTLRDRRLQRYLARRPSAWDLGGPGPGAAVSGEPGMR